MNDIAQTPAKARSRKASLCLVLLGSALFLISAVSLRSHASALQLMREDSLPLAADLTTLQQKLSLLQEQVKLTEQVQSDTRTSIREQISTFVLPGRPDQARSVAVLDALILSLKNDGHLQSASPITVGNEQTSALVPTLHALPLHVNVTADGEGTQSVLLFTELAGDLTIGDVLSSAEQSSFMRACTDGNPANVVALEKFLSLDLLLYSVSPESALQKFIGSVSSSTCSEVAEGTVHNSKLPEAAKLFGGSFGQLLHSRDLWPMPFFAAKAVAVREGIEKERSEVSMELEVLAK